MPTINVVPTKFGPGSTLEYLQSVAPEGTKVGLDHSSCLYIQAPEGSGYNAGLIFDDLRQINFWAEDVPAWLVEFAISIERRTLKPVQINLIKTAKRRP